MSAKSESPFRVNLHELPRRAGEMRQYQLKFPAPEAIGTPLLAIPAGEPIEIKFRAESVSDGVLVTGEISSRAKGECGRCLEALDRELTHKFQELFNYESRMPQRSGAQHKGEEDEANEVDDELFALDGDFADLEVPIRDAVILAMPINPVCRPDCRGLCSECGERLDSLPEGHSHTKIDPRWSGLAGWQQPKEP